MGTAAGKGPASYFAVKTYDDNRQSPVMLLLGVFSVYGPTRAALKFTIRYDLSRTTLRLVVRF